ncbi:hypothetical protein H4684_003883 [Desulfomicrobium macestii]|uniref:AAA+ ATPase domain-containing protein n=1 Tax=Desulfomicrobium macestii TaxID=90731 RepID=A0ABR9H907_9BACT|nr:AAA family ATPase [Desulfomicrobium macestii]MBE1427194.1 hypothetical protein [Desulfomicrobium macestii]
MKQVNDNKVSELYSEIMGANLHNIYFSNNFDLNDFLLNAVELLCSNYKFKAMDKFLYLSDSEILKGYWFDIDNNNQIKWYINNVRGIGYVKFYSLKYNLTTESACKEIVKKFGWNDILNIKEHKYKVIDKNQFQIFNDGVYLAVPQNLICYNFKYIKSDIIFFKNYSGMNCFSVIIYRNVKKSVVVPLILIEEEYQDGFVNSCLAPGVPNKLLPLFAADVLNQKKRLNVILCCNLDVGNNLRKLLCDSQSVSQDEFLITFHYGGVDYIDRTDFSSLYGQNVFIVPDADRNSFLNLSKYVDKCAEVESLSVKIFNIPVLSHEINSVNVDTDMLSCPWERHVVKHSFSYFQNDFFYIIKHIHERSISFSEYDRWATKVMLSGFDTHRDTNTVPLFKSVRDNMGLKSKSNNLNKIDLDVLISPNNMLLIVGFSNSGKGMVLLTFLQGIAYGTDAFFFKGHSQRKVYIIDGESGETRLLQRINQLESAYKSTTTDDNNFFYLSLRDLDPKIEFNLMSQDWRNKVKQEMIDNDAKVLAIDNLFSISQKASTSLNKWDELLRWFEGLQYAGIAIILAHHTGKERDRPYGLSQIQSQLQTLLLVKDREYISKEFYKSTHKNSFMDNFFNEEGSFIRLKFQECKPIPYLDGKSYFYHLPLPDEENGHYYKWISEDEFEKENFNTINLSHSKSMNNCLVDIDRFDINDKAYLENNPIALQVVEYAKTKNKFNGSDLEHDLGLKKRKRNKVLNSLVTYCILDRTGSTSDTFYQLRK